MLPLGGPSISRPKRLPSTAEQDTGSSDVIQLACDAFTANHRAMAPNPYAEIVGAFRAKTSVIS